MEIKWWRQTDVKNWVISNEWWVMSDEWWVMSDGNWVTEIEWSNFVTQTGSNFLKSLIAKSYYNMTIIHTYVINSLYFLKFKLYEVILYL